MNHSRFLLIFSLFVTLLLAGCAGDGTTTDRNVTQDIPMSGGTFRFQNNQFVLVVPPNSLNRPTTVTVVPGTDFPANERILASSVFRATSNNDASFSTDNMARVRIHYPAGMVGVNPADFRIYKVEGNQWVALTHSTVNTQDRFVEAMVSGFGTFGIHTGEPVTEPTIFRTILTPGQETQTVVEPDINAFGTATVTVPQNESSVGVRIQSSGLTNVTAAHIHIGGFGIAGPVGATLYTQAMGEFSNDYQVVVEADDLNPAVVPNMAALIQAIRQGNAYINVHTQANGPGAIRGQLGENLRLIANLSGEQEVEPVTTDASGSAVIEFNRDMTEFSIMLDTQNISNVTMAHIHRGAVGQNGPFFFWLYNAETDGAFPAHLHRVIRPSDLVEREGISTFDQAVGLMLSGRAYVNVHTTAHPGGEIRGQIIPPLLPD